MIKLAQATTSRWELMSTITAKKGQCGYGKLNHNHLHVHAILKMAIAILRNDARLYRETEAVTVVKLVIDPDPVKKILSMVGTRKVHCYAR